MASVQEIRDALKSALSVKEGVHATSRVLFFDSITDLVVEFINQTEKDHHLTKMDGLLDEFRHHTISLEAKRIRYRYIGGESGQSERLFSFSDTFAYSFKMKNGAMEIVSISECELPHFICDHFDTDLKCAAFVEWICESQIRIAEVLKKVCGSRFSPLWTRGSSND